MSVSENSKINAASATTNDPTSFASKNQNLKKWAESKTTAAADAATSAKEYTQSNAKKSKASSSSIASDGNKSKTKSSASNSTIKKPKKNVHSKNRKVSLFFLNLKLQS